MSALDHDQTHGGPKHLLPILAASCFVSSMSMRIIDPVVPEMARDFLVPTATVALLASAFSFPYALAQPPLGALGDALGKARIIKIALTILMLSLAVCTFAENIHVMFAARIVGGAAAGGVIPLAFALVGDRFAIEHRQIALSRLLSAIIAGQLTGSVGSGVVASLTDWRTSMALACGLAVVALALTARYLKPRIQGDRPQMSFSGMRQGYREILSNRMSWVCFPAVFLEGILIFGLFPYVAVLLEARHAGGIREAGLVLAGFGVGGLIYTGAVRWMLPRLGVGFLIRSGAIIAATGFALLSFEVSWPVEHFIFIVIGLGFYMIHNSLQTFATELSSRHRAAGVSAHALFFFLGQAAGPVIYGLLFGAVGVTATIILASIVFAGLGLATVHGLARLVPTARL